MLDELNVHLYKMDLKFLNMNKWKTFLLKKPDYLLAQLCFYIILHSKVDYRFLQIKVEDEL